MKVTYSIIIIMAKEQSTVTELHIEKTIYQSSSSKLMYEFAAANAVSFLLSCTPAASTCSSKLSLLSTPRNWVKNQFWLQKSSNNRFIR